MRKIALLMTVIIFTVILVSCGGTNGNEAEQKVTDEVTKIESMDSDDVPEEAEAENKRIINNDGLKEIETNDTFAVKVIKKEVIKDANPGFSFAGNDVLSLTIENKSDKEITDVRVAVVGYDSDNGIIVMGDGSYSMDDDKNVRMYTSGDEKYANDSQNMFNIACKSEKIVGVHAIVASYVDSDGNTVENPVLADWYKSVELGSNIVLD